MKFLMLLFLAFSLNAENLKFLTYKDAYKLNKQNSKEFFVIVGASNCKFCEKLKGNIDNNDELKRYLNKNFNSVYINQDKDFVPVDLLVEATPAIWFVKSNGRPYLQPIFGAVPAIDILNQAKIIKGE